MPIDGEKLSRARLKKGLTQEVFAGLVGVNQRRIQRYESGETRNMEDDLAKKITDVLGLESILQIRPDGEPLMQAESKTHKEGRERAEFIFKIDSNQIPLEEQPLFAARYTAELLRIGVALDETRKVEIEMCKIRIVLEVSTADADRIMEAFRNGELEYLDVENVVLPDRQRFGPRLPLGLSLLGIALGLLAVIPLIRIPASALGLIVSSVALFFAVRRKKHRILSAMATAFNAGILALTLYTLISKPQEEGDRKETPQTVSAESKKDDDREKGAIAKIETAKEPELLGPPSDEEEVFNKAKAKVEQAGLTYEGADVEIGDDVIQALLGWGDTGLLKYRGNIMKTGDIDAKTLGLDLNIDVKDGTGYMGNRGGYCIIAGYAGGVRIPLTEQLVVYVPFGNKGFGTPFVVEGQPSPKGKDLIYVTNVRGYLLIKQRKPR